MSGFLCVEGGYMGSTDAFSVLAVVLLHPRTIWRQHSIYIYVYIYISGRGVENENLK